MAKRASHWQRKRQYWARQLAWNHTHISRADARRIRVKQRQQRRFQKMSILVAEACRQASRSTCESFMGLDLTFGFNEQPIVTIQSSEHSDWPGLVMVSRPEGMGSNGDGGTGPWTTMTFDLVFGDMEEAHDPSDASQVMPGVDSEHVTTEAWESEVQRVLDEARARREGYR